MIRSRRIIVAKDRRYVRKIRLKQENILLQPNEEIRPIIGYEGLYSVTSFGRVWSHKRKIEWNNTYRFVGERFLKPIKTRCGYLQVNLYKDFNKKGYLINRLAAKHYIINPQNLPEVNHRDGVKTNNYVGTAAKNYEDGNLEWCTNQGNRNHAVSNNLIFKKNSKYYGVSLNMNQKVKNKYKVRVKINKKPIYVGSYRTEIEAAREYNKYILDHALDRPLNDVNEDEYLRAIKETKSLTKYRGVSKKKRKNNLIYETHIRFKGQTKYLGFYKTEIEAAQRYDNFVTNHNLNKPLNNI